MPGKHFDLDISKNLGGSNASDLYIASQKATKDYIDTKISEITIEDINLVDLKDVNITSAVANNALVYDATTQKWINKTINQWGQITGTITNQTDLKQELDKKANDADLAAVAKSGSYNDLKNKPTIPDVTDYDTHIADTTIHVTSTDKTTWNNKQDSIEDLSSIRSNASKGATAIQPNDNISKLTNDAGYLTEDDLTSAMIYQGSVQTYADLPASGNKKGDFYNVVEDDANYAWSGTDWDFVGKPVDLSGYQPKITSTNKLSADLLTEGTTNKLVSQTEKNLWNSKQDSISDLTTIRSNAQAGKTASDTIANYGDIVTHNAAEFQPAGDYADAVHTHTIANVTNLQTTLDGKQAKITSTNKLSADLIADGTTNKVVTATEKTTWNDKQDAIADLATIRSGASAGSTALQPGNNISELTNDAGYTDNIGTITGITMNGVSKGTSGVVNLGTVITAHQDISGKQDVIEDLDTIRAGATAGSTAVQPADLATVATTGSYIDLTNKPTIPTVNNATITIQKNGTKVDSFTANQASAKTINITVPTTAEDVSALPNTTKYATSLALSIDSDTYVITAQLKDQSGANLGTAQTIDLPLESVVVSGSYDNTNKKIVLTLQSGSTVDIPVGDLVVGLQSQITSTNKLSADLIADGTTNKVVTSAEKTKWNGKQDAISDLATIRSNATSGKDAADTIATYGDIVTHDAADFAEATHTHTAGQVSGLANVATSGSYTDLSNKPTIPTVTDTYSATSTNAMSGKAVASAIANKMDKVTLATVATSGSYNDLTNKPTIPTITDTYSATSSNGMSGKAVASAISGLTKTTITFRAW